MDANPVVQRLGRRLRLAVVGGGPGSFIGAMHRAAARIDQWCVRRGRWWPTVSSARSNWCRSSTCRAARRPNAIPIRTPNGPGTLPLAARASRIVKGHPEGFHEGFANLYSDAAEAIAARRAGVTPDPLALHFPTADDGYRGVAFVEAAIASSNANGAWTPVR